LLVGTFQAGGLEVSGRVGTAASSDERFLVRERAQGVAQQAISARKVADAAGDAAVETAKVVVREVGRSPEVALRQRSTRLGRELGERRPRIRMHPSALAPRLLGDALSLRTQRRP